jgi:hypothetical protein
MIEWIEWNRIADEEMRKIVQERAGQRELVNSSVLPVEMSPSREAFERLGFRFGEQVDGDPLFIHVELPAGWTRAGTDHAMWSDVVDQKGRRRVAVFYKAAFYDRRANMSLQRRYDLRNVDNDVGEWTWLQLVDGAIGEDVGPRWTKDEWHDGEIGRWLDAERPDHKDPVKAWEVKP